MIKKYQKKPVRVYAVKWEGTDESLAEIVNWMRHEVKNLEDNKIGIETLEGIMEASVGDYIIRGVKGEFYPCKPDIFEETYDEIIDTSKIDPAKEVKRFNDGVLKNPALVEKLMRSREAMEQSKEENKDD